MIAAIIWSILAAIAYFAAASIIGTALGYERHWLELEEARQRLIDESEAE